MTSLDAHIELLHRCLRAAVELDASDLHLRSGSPPFVRTNGRLMPIPGAPTLTADDLTGVILELTERTPWRRAELKERGEVDSSYELAGVARFRITAFRERGNTAVALRVIPPVAPRLAAINMPAVLGDLALESCGLILVSGAAGAGRSTTLAAMVDHINRERPAHILTIEDPIEVVHSNLQSLVSQRELGSDTGDLRQALDGALRKDPDVIAIGEVRDEQTMHAALVAAGTGRLVLASLQTNNVVETIARALDFFPAAFQPQARALLAGALRGIVSQRLAHTLDGGRVPVVEVMVNTASAAACIAEADGLSRLPKVIAAGECFGMQSLDQALLRLIADGQISEDEALNHVSDPHDFRQLLQSTLGQLSVTRTPRQTPLATPANAADEMSIGHDRAAAEVAASTMPATQLAPAPIPQPAVVPVPGPPTPGNSASPPPPPTRMAS